MADERDDLYERLRKAREQLPSKQRQAEIRKAVEAAEETLGKPAVREALRRMRADLAAHEAERKAEEEQRLLDAAIRWLENKWADRSCPYCGHYEWQVGTPLEISVGTDEVMSPAFPVMCGNCGQTTFINAIRAGLLPEEQEE